MEGIALRNFGEEKNQGAVRLASTVDSIGLIDDLRFMIFEVQSVMKKQIQKIAVKMLKNHRIRTPYSWAVRIRSKQSTHPCNFDL